MQTKTSTMLDLLADKESQLAVIVPYLEEAASSVEELPGLPLNSRSYVLAYRYLRGLGSYVTGKGEQRLSTEGVFRYYLKLVGEE